MGIYSDIMFFGCSFFFVTIHKNVVHAFMNLHKILYISLFIMGNSNIQVCQDRGTSSGRIFGSKDLSEKCNWYP